MCEGTFRHVTSCQSESHVLSRDVLRMSWLKGGSDGALQLERARAREDFVDGGGV